MSLLRQCFEEEKKQERLSIEFAVLETGSIREYVVLRLTQSIVLKPQTFVKRFSAAAVQMWTSRPQPSD